MKHSRFRFACTSLCFAIASVCSVFAEETIEPNRSDYFLYGIVGLSVVVLGALAVLLYFRRRH